MDNKYILELILENLPEDVITEYKFYPSRKFRADYFIKINDSGIIVELEGAIFTQGRHTRGKGYARDCAKYNFAAEMGYPVLRYNSESLKDPEAVEKQIKKVIENFKTNDNNKR